MAAPIGFGFVRFLSVNMLGNAIVTVNKRISHKVISSCSLPDTTRFLCSATKASSQPDLLGNKNESPVTLSDSCVQRIKSIQSSGEFLRIAVDGGGCSGFQYTFNMDTSVNPDDKIIERNGARIIVDETSLAFLKGSIIDYHEELIRSAFRVKENPNADNGCSCGASFSVKN